MEILRWAGIALGSWLAGGLVFAGLLLAGRAHAHWVHRDCGKCASGYQWAHLPEPAREPV